MKPLALARLLFMCGLAAAQKAPVPSVVGTWKYDVKSVRFELNAQAKKQMNDPKHKDELKQFIAKLTKDLKATVKTMTVTFKPGGAFSAKSSKPPGETKGTWKLDGRIVKVVMTNTAQLAPELELSKDGKRIRTAFSDARFGTGLVDLVRAK